MKKFFALLLALMMCLSLSACGGSEVDTQPAIDAFNEASTAFNTLADEVNANPDAFDDEFIADLQEMSASLSEYQATLESGEALTEENVNDLVSAFGEVKTWADDAYVQVQEQLEAAETDTGLTDRNGEPVTQGTLDALTAAYNAVAVSYNAIATNASENGWMADAQTAAEINALSTTLGAVGTALSEDLTQLDGSDFEGLIDQFSNELPPALEELAERVSVPYEG